MSLPFALIYLVSVAMFVGCFAAGYWVRARFGPAWLHLFGALVSGFAAALLAVFALECSAAINTSSHRCVPGDPSLGSSLLLSCLACREPRWAGIRIGMLSAAPQRAGWLTDDFFLRPLVGLGLGSR